MEWWTRLVGSAQTSSKPAARSGFNDPQQRLARLKRVYQTILGICNRPRQIANEQPLLDQLHGCLDRVSALIREDARAPIPHLTLQFAASQQIYTVIARAATISQYEPIVYSTVAVFAALVDSDEEDYLSSGAFAKSLMRLATKVVDSGAMLISTDTETAILELLFTIAAKIRLQPEMLSFWFRSTAKPELEDVFVKEKKSFVGITKRDDFTLCYILIDRVHHEGRVGDFARTGLLYIFEAAGRSIELEEWLVSSDLPTLMASGLGALYSQLSRELSILHHDATLPAVLSMSDYNTARSQAVVESAFSERHKNHIATFLSYLAFWQDVLDHCKSDDVKQTLLDHFQILFLKQLLYPSLLQSSDTDAGSSVAVLTYMTAMLDSLEYPELVHMMLAYLLAVQDGVPSVPDTPVTPSRTPRSPTTLRRRQSLMLLTAPKDPAEAVEPTLFNLVDLILNNVSSMNSQSVLAALQLSSTLLSRHKQFALGTLLKVQSARRQPINRTVGALDLELEKLAALALSLHERFNVDEVYLRLVEDVRVAVEMQSHLAPPTAPGLDQQTTSIGCYVLSSDDLFLKALTAILWTFFTNSVDVNLALTQTIISITLCIDVRLDGWLAIDPASYRYTEEAPGSQQKPWHALLNQEDASSLSASQQASRRPLWLDPNASVLYAVLQALSHELQTVRISVPNMDTLISGRKHMLQAASLDTASITSEPPSLPSSPTQTTFPDVPKLSKGHSRASSQASVGAGRNKAANSEPPDSPSFAASTAPSGSDDLGGRTSSSLRQDMKSIYMPPPPETPSTTDVLMQTITFPAVHGDDDQASNLGNVPDGLQERTASLNHVLTNVVVLQEFVLELVAVLQVRAAVLGDKEVRSL